MITPINVDSDAMLNDIIKSLFEYKGITKLSLYIVYNVEGSRYAKITLKEREQICLFSAQDLLILKNLDDNTFYLRMGNFKFAQLFNWYSQEIGKVDTNKIFKSKLIKISKLIVEHIYSIDADVIKKKYEQQSKYAKTNTKTIQTKTKVIQTNIKAIQTTEEKNELNAVYEYDIESDSKKCYNIIWHIIELLKDIKVYKIQVVLMHSNMNGDFITINVLDMYNILMCYLVDKHQNNLDIWMLDVFESLLNKSLFEVIQVYDQIFGELHLRIENIFKKNNLSMEGLFITIKFEYFNSIVIRQLSDEWIQIGERLWNKENKLSVQFIKYEGEIIRKSKLIE
jgi:hypothetical protein